MTKKKRRRKTQEIAGNKISGGPAAKGVTQKGVHGLGLSLPKSNPLIIDPNIQDLIQPMCLEVQTRPILFAQSINAYVLNMIN